MPYKRYDIVSYVAWLQKEARNFGGFLEQAVPVQATITCHPSDRSDFDRLYFVFIDGTSFPQNRIRQRPNRKEVYIFVPASFYSPYIDF